MQQTKAWYIAQALSLCLFLSPFRLLYYVKHAALARPLSKALNIHLFRSHLTTTTTTAPSIIALYALLQRSLNFLPLLFLCARSVLVSAILSVRERERWERGGRTQLCSNNVAVRVAAAVATACCCYSFCCYSLLLLLLVVRCAAALRRCGDKWKCLCVHCSHCSDKYLHNSSRTFPSPRSRSLTLPFPWPHSLPANVHFALVLLALLSFLSDCLCCCRSLLVYCLRPLISAAALYQVYKTCCFCKSFVLSMYACCSSLLLSLSPSLIFVSLCYTPLAASISLSASVLAIF